MARIIKKSAVRLPPGCGEDLGEVLLANPYQTDFMEKRRLRFCLVCKTQGSMDANCNFTCLKCGTVHHSNLTAPRVFDRFLVLAGRGGGKTLIGAHACREEMLVPNSIGWVMGPTFKILWDSTFPTLIRRIPPEWVKRWDPEHDELILVNNAKVAFRSLEDPERARGPHGVSWGWFDEAAQSPERAYDVFVPTLIKAGGIVIATTTVLGYDWTYERIEKKALVEQKPGFYACRYWTEENPLFKTNPVMMRAIDEARSSSTPEFFAQEYKAERHNATGLIYDYKLIEKQCLLNDQEVRRLIPEWPSLDPTRNVLVGLDSGADHPFGAIKAVVTEGGIVVVGEYLERQKAVSAHLAPIHMRFGLQQFAPDNISWCANKNEANLRLEFALKNIGVMPVEAKHEIGIQRVQSWLLTGQLYFAAQYCPKVVEQMRAYRYADNIATDGQKKAKEAVFKKDDELPDAVRYAIMGWPDLPVANKPVRTDREQARWDALDEQSRMDIERVKAFDKRDRRGKDLDDDDPSYPLGDFFNGPQEDIPW